MDVIETNSIQNICKEATNSVPPFLPQPTPHPKKKKNKTPPVLGCFVLLLLGV